VARFAPMVLALVPIVGWVAAALLVMARSRSSLTLRDSLLVGVALAGGWLVLGTEVLSLSHALRFWPVLAWWTLPTLVTLSLLLGRGPALRESLPRRPRLTLPQCLLAAAVAFPLAWSWCQACFAPPNNIDSVSYHLPRQVFWMQQASVENYPTSSLRQIAMPPLTEFAGLHLMILTGSDRLHNLVQWCALGLTMCAVSLITRRSGGTATAQLLSALWVATFPMAFLQASNTKNDVVVALWTCLLSYWVMQLQSASPLRWRQAALLGLGFGALLLTKGTGMIYGLPVAGVMLFLLLRHHARRAAPTLLLMTIAVLSMNAGAFLRNYEAFGTPLPEDPAIHGGDTVVNQEISVRALASNVVRNLAPHLTTPSEPLNDRLTRLVVHLHEMLGLDVNDPRTTWLEGRFRPYTFTQCDEDTAAAPIHMLLLLLMVPAALVSCRRRGPGGATLMLLILSLSGFLLFCVLLKWQLWHVRLIVALAALLAPVFAWSLSARATRRAAPFAVLALLVGLTPSLNSRQHPLFGPLSVLTSDADSVRYYPATDRGRMMAKQAERMNRLQPRTLGISSGWSFPDYLLQRALLDRMARPPAFTAFNAILQVPGKKEPDPDVLLVAGSGTDRMQHASSGTWYVKRGRMRPYDLFLREGDPREASGGEPILQGE
jgi:hypothetical protein